MTPRYGDKHDALIDARLRAGSTKNAIVRELGVWHGHVTRRVEVLGLTDLAQDNYEAWKERHGYTAWGPRAVALAEAGRVEVAPPAYVPASDVIRRVRYHSPVTVACIDPDHVVACLHERGVTLPDIEDHLGIPQPEAVAAIRRFAGLSA